MNVTCVSSYIIYLYMIHDFLRLQRTTLWAEQPRNESAPSCKQSWFGSHCRSRSGWGCLADMKINCYHKRMASIFCLHWIRTVGQPYYGATWLFAKNPAEITGFAWIFRNCRPFFVRFDICQVFFPLPWCDHQLLSPVAFAAKGASVLGHSWALTSIRLHFDAKGRFVGRWHMNRQEIVCRSNRFNRINVPIPLGWISERCRQWSSEVYENLCFCFSGRLFFFCGTLGCAQKIPKC